MSNIEGIRKIVTDADNFILDSTAAIGAATESHGHAHGVLAGLLGQLDAANAFSRHLGDTFKVTHTYTDAAIGKAAAAEGNLHGASNGSENPQLAAAVAETGHMHDLLTGNEESITAMLRDHTERAHSITRGIATLALEARELLQLTDLPIGQLERAAEVSGFAHEATKGYLDTLDGVADSVRG